MVTTSASSGKGSQNVPDGESPWYDAEVYPDSATVAGKIVRLVGDGKRVLELGCATGYMSRVMRDRGCRVVAIEISPEMAERAAEFCERVIVGDIEQIDLARELGEDRFDVVVAADFLEHLKAPLSVLRAVKDYLLTDGYIVASIPNVAHGSVRLALLGGRFPYSRLGLLDRTHLRFYTRETIRELFDDAGFVISYMDWQGQTIGNSEVPYDSAVVPPGLVEDLSKDPDALAYQFIVVAFPASEAGSRLVQWQCSVLVEEKESAQREVARLQRAVEEQENIARRDIELARSEVARLQQVLEEQEDIARRDIELARSEAAQHRQTVEEQKSHVDLLLARIDHLSSQTDALRASLLDAHDLLVRQDDEIQFLRGREARLHLLEREHSLWVQNREQHIAELQAALDGILYSVPGRLYRNWRKIMTLGRQ